MMIRDDYGQGKYNISKMSTHHKKRVHPFLLLVTLYFVGKTVAWAISSKEETAYTVYFFEAVKKAYLMQQLQL